MSEYRNIGIWISKTQEPVITQYLAGVNSPGFPVHTEFMVPHSSRKLKSLHWKFFLLWSANMSFYTVIGLTWVGHVLHIVQQILPGSRLNIYNKLMFLDSNMQYHMDLFFFIFSARMLRSDIIACSLLIKWPFWTNPVRAYFYRSGIKIPMDLLIPSNNDFSKISSF